MTRRQSKRPAPAFQMYAGDWLSSTRIALMTPAQEGAYCRLLMHCWLDADCSLPDDDEQLALLSRLGSHWQGAAAERIRACFVAHPKKTGRLTQLRLLEERKKQAAWRKKCASGGVKSGQSRRKASKGSSGVVQQQGEVNGNSSSSSSSSTSEVNTHTRSAGAREGPMLGRGSPPEIITPEGANPEELPPSVDHWALWMHWEVYHVGLDLETQQRVAAAVTDRELWRQALEYWVDGNYRGRSIPKIVKKYRELEAERDKQRNGKVKRSDGGGAARGGSYSDRNEAALEEVFGTGDK